MAAGTQMRHCSGKDRPFCGLRPGGRGKVVTGCASYLHGSFSTVWYASTK